MVGLHMRLWVVGVIQNAFECFINSRHTKPAELIGE